VNCQSRPGEHALSWTRNVANGPWRGDVYVGDRENKRIQVFDGDGRFLKEWTGIGYP
jgi:hypothetical protein